MYAKTIDELIRNIGKKGNKATQSKELTKFFCKVRFGSFGESFEKKFVDGQDGGIDYCDSNENKYYIDQTKFYSKPRNENSPIMIKKEIYKIFETITSEEVYKKAITFMDDLRNDINNRKATLYIEWITTNKIPESTKKSVISYVVSLKKRYNFKMNVKIQFFDYEHLSRLNVDHQYGFFPHFGEFSLKLIPKCYHHDDNKELKILSITGTSYVDEILKWYNSEEEIFRSLNKNLRGFLGKENDINSDICKSYLDNQNLFLYRNLGVTILADSFSQKGSTVNLVNPQIINGGQTISSLFIEYNKNKKSNKSSKIFNGSKIPIRIISVPYGMRQTYEKIIKSIYTLSTQNKIETWDRKSIDPRQVYLEFLFNEIGINYYRKSSQFAKGTKKKIVMRNLAIPYYACCGFNPRNGYKGKQKVFKDSTGIYDEIFDKHKIMTNLKQNSINHVLFDYLLAWELDKATGRVGSHLEQEQKDCFKYIKPYALALAFDLMKKWQTRKRNFTPHTYTDFLTDKEFTKEITSFFIDTAFPLATLHPIGTNPRNYYDTDEAEDEFDYAITEEIKDNFKEIMDGCYKKFLASSIVLAC